MKKIFQNLLLLPILFIGNSGCDLCYYCEDESSKYVMAKWSSYNHTSPAGSTSEVWTWDRNIATIKNKEGIKIRQRTYNDYGWVTESLYFDGSGNISRTYKYTYKEKWKRTKYESSSGTTYNYTWNGNIRNQFRDDGSLWEALEYDDYGRLIKFTLYSSDGGIYYEDLQTWDQKYRYRGLSRTRSSFTGFYYKSTWDGDTNYYTQYDRNGNIDYISTETVNAYDQTLIRTRDDYSWTYEYSGELFKPYK
jgi:hypothetical protein